jgi:catechol 2,3-dioxygenase-like lactoylglutathione lyase family enzyme
MELGVFSVSLAVADLAKSRSFYETLGFTKAGGDAAQGWLILRNGSTTIGLFQGMFDKNMLTFNPGWNQQAEPLESFKDVRVIQSELLEKGVELIQTADTASKGPASITMLDPDGNPVLIDQHV